jgi:type IV fimbrial biogenesis protein FimT
MGRTTGMTLLEILLTLGLLGVLLSTGLADMSDWTQAMRARQITRSLAAQIALARSTATARQQWVSLCPTRDHLGCGGSWSQGSMVFSDRNADRRVNQDDIVIRVHGPLPSGETLQWRAFQSRPYLQIDASGFMRHQSGNFTWCPASRDVRFARQIVVNATGRGRVSQDSDEDDIHEDSAGNPLACP